MGKIKSFLLECVAALVITLSAIVFIGLETSPLYGG